MQRLKSSQKGGEGGKGKQGDEKAAARQGTHTQSTARACTAADGIDLYAIKTGCMHAQLTQAWRAPRRSAVMGVCSASLSTTVLPHASAGASFQAAMSSGKFQGLRVEHRVVVGVMDGPDSWDGQLVQICEQAGQPGIHRNTASCVARVAWRNCVGRGACAVHMDGQSKHAEANEADEPVLNVRLCVYVRLT